MGNTVNTYLEMDPITSFPFLTPHEFRGACEAVVAAAAEDLSLPLPGSHWMHVSFRGQVKILLHLISGSHFLFLVGMVASLWVAVGSFKEKDPFIRSCMRPDGLHVG